MRRIGLLVMVVVVGAALGFGQNYEATIQLTPNGAILNVDLYLATTTGPSAILGDATLTINYDAAVLTYIGKDASMDGRWDNGNDASYQDVVASNVAPKASLTILKSGTGVGLDIPGGATRVGRLQFTILAPTGNPKIGWNTGLSVVYNLAGDEITGGFVWTDPDDLPLPVTLTSFAGVIEPSEAGVRLEWKTLSEVNNYGFTVQRKGENAAEFRDLEGAFIEGKGTTLDPQSYSYVDRTVSPGTWDYRLKQQDLDGTLKISQSVRVVVTLTDVAEATPTVFELSQNYPNPFNPTTMIQFALPRESRVTLAVYNLLGQRVATLVEESRPAGYYAVPFNATNLASGLYIYKLTAEQTSFVRKMMVVK